MFFPQSSTEPNHVKHIQYVTILRSTEISLVSKPLEDLLDISYSANASFTVM